MNKIKPIIKTNNLEEFNKHIFSHQNINAILQPTIVFCLKRRKYDMVSSLVNFYVEHLRNKEENIITAFYTAYNKYPLQQTEILEFLRSLNMMVDSEYLLEMYINNTDFFFEILQEGCVSINTSSLEDILYVIKDNCVIVDEEWNRDGYDEVIVEYNEFSDTKAFRIGSCLSKFYKFFNQRYEYILSDFDFENIMNYMKVLLQKYDNINISDFFDCCLSTIDSINNNAHRQIIDVFYKENRYDLFLKNTELLCDTVLYETFSAVLDTDEKYITTLYEYLYKNNIKISLKRLVHTYFDKSGLSKHVYSIYKRLLKNIKDEVVDAVLEYEGDDIMKNYIDIVSSVYYLIERDVIMYIPLSVIKKYLYVDNKTDKQKCAIMYIEAVNTIYYLNMTDYEDAESFVDDLLKYVDFYIGKNKEVVRGMLINEIDKIQYLEDFVNKNVSSIVYRYMM